MNAEIVATLEERYPSPSEFDLPSFLDVHLKPITKARTSVERSKLFDAANRFLEENAPAIRVWLEIVDTDHAELYLYTGKTGMFIKRWKVSPETP